MLYRKGCVDRRLQRRSVQGTTAPVFCEQVETKVDVQLGLFGGYKLNKQANYCNVVLPAERDDGRLLAVSRHPLDRRQSRITCQALVSTRAPPWPGPRLGDARRYFIAREARFRRAHQKPIQDVEERLTLCTDIYSGC